MKINPDNLLIYRKRIIPDEMILLKDDIILDVNENYLITKWNAIRPKKELHHGYSLYAFNEGIKVSKFLREDGTLLYWYCDIIDYSYDAKNNELICTDLLADVVIYPSNEVRVVDLDELAQVLESNLCDSQLVINSLQKTDSLLQKIYHGHFKEYTDILENYIS